MILLRNGIFLSFFSLILGLIIGSFINVLVYRVPKGESIVYPTSHCPECKHPLKWYDLIPLLSYIMLRGKCRYCGHKIPVRYPVIELVAGLAFMGVALKYGWSFNLLKYVIFSGLLITVSFIDILDGVVPDIVVIPGAAIGLIFAIIQGKTIFLDSLYGLLVMGGFFVLIILLTRGKGMGQGDATLGIMIGAFLGLKFSIAALFISVIIGGIGGVIAILFMRKKRSDTMPFGPFLAIAAYIMLLYGFEFLSFYLSFFNF